MLLLLGAMSHCLGVWKPLFLTCFFLAFLLHNLGGVVSIKGFLIIFPISLALQLIAFIWFTVKQS